MSIPRFLAALIAVSVLAAAEPPKSQPYVWKNVQMVGGGFVDGIVFHPTAKGVRYARTDIGGAYRWNEQTQRWEPLLDWLSYDDRNLMGVESIALDPSDPNRLYLACGTYTSPETPDGAILRSSDRGKTFQRSNVPFKFGGNENGRGNGERMAVDPHDGRIIYLGTRHAGLWWSTDRGVSWKKVAAFPEFTEPPPNWMRSGIDVVVFDPRSGRRGTASKTIYVAASLMDQNNLFRSTDGGRTWQPVPGQPTQYRPNHMVLASDGALYVSYGTDPGPWHMRDGGVWKLDTATGGWTDITPEKPAPDQKKEFGYGAVAVDARNPRTLIASTFHHPDGEEIFRSTYGGATWKPVFAGGGTYDFSAAPYVAVTPIHWLLDIEIDPRDANHAMFTTGYGGYETFDLSDVDAGRPTKWSVMSTGIEETVALDLLSPPKGAPLLTAIGDYGGFVHWDLDKPAPEGSYDNPHFGNTTSLACAEKNPDVIVRVGRASGHRVRGNIGYSLDGGRTWQRPASTPRPNSQLGSVAVSSDGAAWVWTPEHDAAWFTRDRGATWAQSQGIPAGTQVIADRVNPRTFYGMALFDGTLFVSTDGAATFVERPLNLPDGLPTRGHRGDERGGQDRLYATPDREGDLWLAAFNGLYHSLDSGATWSRLPNVQQIHAFGFGKSAQDAAESTLKTRDRTTPASVVRGSGRSAPRRDYSALYLIGTVDGMRGIFRSDDVARRWVRINDDQHQWGLLLQITGDPKQYGRVYVGTHGRGTLYGDPAPATR